MNKLINDIEKAIDALKMDNALMEFDPNTGEERPIEFQNELNQCAYKANLLAISALEKQIPKKPLEQRYVNYEIENELIGHCPSCRLKWDVSFWQRHCSNCGQKLDWSVEE